MYVDVEPGMRTAAAVAWEAAGKISLLLVPRYRCSIGVAAVYCSSTGCRLLLLLRAL